MQHISSYKKWPHIAPGEALEISGELLTLRDGTLKKLFQEEKSPEILQKSIVYFCGPTPPPPGKIIGSCGPTTSGRMEPYFEKMMQCGVRALIGKGEISQKSKDILKKYNGYYFAATGGIGAYLSSKVKKAECIRFPELGPEAIYALQVEHFPLLLSYK